MPDCSQCLGEQFGRCLAFCISVLFCSCLFLGSHNGSQEDEEEGEGTEAHGQIHRADPIVI